MARGKLTIAKSYQDDIRSIEKLLKDYKVIIDDNHTILNQHIAAFKEIVEELRNNDIASREEVLRLHDKLDEILNIKVNGTVGLKNVLAVVYEDTSAIRANKNVKKSVKEWINTHSTVKAIFNSKPVTIVLTIFFTLIVLRIFGIDVSHIDPIAFFKDLHF